MDEANRAERILGDAIGRHIIEAIDAGFQPPPGGSAGYGDLWGVSGPGGGGDRGSWGRCGSLSLEGEPR
jgi:hypothetical protein